VTLSWYLDKNPETLIIFITGKCPGISVVKCAGVERWDLGGIILYGGMFGGIFG